jgi:hypothetical protein
MNRIFPAAIGILLGIQTQAQNTLLPSCGVFSWDNIRISSDKNPDTTVKIFFISRRSCNPGGIKGEVFPRGISDTLLYFIAAGEGDGWNLHFVHDFTEGMLEIDNGRDILLFIEGHGKSFPEALERACMVQARYGVSILVFDWPSDNRNIKISLKMIKSCEDDFCILLTQIRDFRDQQINTNQHFNILAHSMGNYFLYDEGKCPDYKVSAASFVDNIVMNAPAVPSAGHDTLISQLTLQKRIYVTSNKNDYVLRGAGLISKSKMLGNRVTRPLAPNAVYVNFTGIAGKEHSYYYGSHEFENSIKAVFAFYHAALHGNEVNLTDGNSFVLRPTGDGYDIRDRK